LYRACPFETLRASSEPAEGSSIRSTSAVLSYCAFSEAIV
jgi:hypothetical protein